MDSTAISRTEGMPFYKLIIRCALFTLIFCIISILIVGVMSVIFYNTQNPTAKITLLGYVALYLSVFLTSFIMTKSNGEKWLFGGLILGAMIFLLTLFFSIFVKEAGNAQSIIFRALIILDSLASAFLARKRGRKKEKHKRPHMHR